MSKKSFDIGEAFLPEIIKEDVNIRLVEPHLYSVYSQTENVGSYDRFAGIYDRVACNTIYNRIMWGYWILDYHTFCSSSLETASNGWVLDVGCGSLAFTAKTYVRYLERPVVFLDQSIRLLRMAKAKFMRLRGSVPEKMIFLHADALDLPFRNESFKTIVCMNLLHVFSDVRPFLAGLKSVAADGSTMSFTRIVLNDRFSDAYLRTLANTGALVARTLQELEESFHSAGIPINHTVKGNLAFLYQSDPKL